MYKTIGKRWIDVVFALIVLILLVIPFIVVAILIKLESEGPVFFKQKRLGLHKKEFEIYKFRSMTNKERKITQTFKSDPEITRVGYYLRRFKIDEMPQIINVLNGDMSVIGPRPCLPNVVEKYGLDNHRFLVKPGLSSIAGVNGSIFLTWEEKWWYDKYYVENLSFWLDLKIFFKTFLIIALGEEKFLNKPNLN